MGRVAQLVEHHTVYVKVVGSSPIFFAYLGLTHGIPDLAYYNSLPSRRLFNTLENLHGILKIYGVFALNRVLLVPGCFKRI